MGVDFLPVSKQDSKEGEGWNLSYTPFTTIITVCITS